MVLICFGYSLWDLRQQTIEILKFSVFGFLGTKETKKKEKKKPAGNLGICISISIRYKRKRV